MAARPRLLGAVAASLCLAAAALDARAAVFVVTNGSFEEGVFDEAGTPSHVMSLPVGSTVLTGWTVVGGELAWGRNDNLFVPNGATHGSYFLDLTGFHDAAPYGGITQAVDTVPSSTYELSFDLITYQSDSRYAGPVSVTASAGATTQTFTFTPPAGSTGVQSERFTLPFTATDPTTVLTIQGASAGGGQFIGLDNVAPEPVAAASIAAGGWGILAATRRGRRR